MLLALAVFPVRVQTDAPANRVHDYNYFDVSYPYLGMGGPSGSGHGLGAAAGIRVHDWFPFHAFGSFVTISAGEADTTILDSALALAPVRP